MLYVAVDQHSKQLTVNIRNESGDVMVRRQVSTDWERVRAFWSEVRDQSVSAGGFAVILEVCGFNDWLIKMLTEYGCGELVLVQADDRSRTKTDRRDANRLGELLWVNRAKLRGGQRVPGLKRVHVESAQVTADRQLTSVRLRLVQQRTRTINRVRHLLLKHNVAQHCPTAGIQTNKALQWLKTLSLPVIDRLEMDQLLEQWQLLEKQRSAIDEQIQQRQSADSQAALIATVPGASAYSSLTLSCRIGDASRFTTPGSLPNFWGLAPGCRNSGETKARLGSITKEGSSVARSVLGQLVLHVLKKDAWMRLWYRQIKMRRGSKIARVAVMRRLAMIIWSMIRNQEPYCCGGPAAMRERRQLSTVQTVT